MSGRTVRQEIKVVGVTFANSNGSSRQQILEELDNEYGERLNLSQAELRRYQFRGDPAYHIVIDGKTVGNLASTLAEKLSRLEDDGCEIWIEDPRIVGGKSEFSDILGDDDEDLTYGMRVTICVLDPRRPVEPEATAPSNMYCGGQGRTDRAGNSSKKSRLVALLLCIFLGGFGVHRFYVGKIGTGIVWLLTAGCFGIGWIIDMILIVCGAMRDKDGYCLSNWE